MSSESIQLDEPPSYFSGAGRHRLSAPTNVLLFLRTEKRTLQQEALLNRSHHRYVLIVNLQTEGRVHVDNLVLPFRPGQALLILPYQFHHYSQLAARSLQWLFCTFAIEPNPILDPLRNRVVDVGPKTRRAVADLLDEWKAQSEEFKAELIQSRTLQLLLALRQDSNRIAFDRPARPRNNLIRTVNRHLEANGGRSPSVSDLGDKMGYSPSRLRVLFKDAAGIPLGRYIRNYRLNRAMALLRTTDLAIAQIAEETGFGSPQAFSETFRKTMGQTPRSYRRPSGKA